MITFEEKVKNLFAQHEELITRKNEPVETTNGVYTRYKYPVVTAAHTPIFWRYDLDEKTNPYLMELLPPSSQPTKSNWNRPTSPQLMPPMIIRIRHTL